MKRMKLCLVTLLGLSLGISAFASGSYNARPPRFPGQVSGDREDSQKYALGKKIYTGKAKLAAHPTAEQRAAQERRLQELQARLPEKARAKANLPQYAGSLSQIEMEALEYYVLRRYPKK